MRAQGEGSIRIGTKLKLNEDVYATLFASLIYHDIVKKLEQKQECEASG